jgi:hypothetical protein
MKKYFFVLSFFAILAAVACNTSSKASTTQTVAAQSQPVAAPTAIVEMAPLQKTAPGTPAKN